MSGSWKTSTAGWAAIAAAAGIVLTQIGYQFDNDLATVCDWGVLSAAVVGLLSGIGNLFARDNKVTSEDVGAK